MSPAEQPITAYVSDLLDFEIIKRSLENYTALNKRIEREAIDLQPSLALSINSGLILSIVLLEGYGKSLLKRRSTLEIQKIFLQDLPRQRARIEFALAAAAQAAGAQGIAAPATDEAIDAFLGHLDESWIRFVNGVHEVWMKVEGSDFQQDEINLWQVMHRQALTLRLAAVGLRRLHNTRSNIETEPHQFDLVTSINEAIQTIEMETMGTNRQIVFLPVRDHVTVSGMAYGGTQFIKELIQNAVMFSPLRSEIRISVTSEGRSAAFFVDDDGVGFKGLTPETALKPFHRGEDAPNNATPYCRLGIGLTLLSLIAKRAGWSLEFADGKCGPRPLLIFP